MARWDVHFHAYVDLRDVELLRTVARVESLSGLLREVPLPPRLRQKLDRMNIIRAVRGTTGIEGSELTEEEVAQVVNAPPGELVLGANRAREEAEARNAFNVMTHIRDVVDQDTPYLLTEADVKELHRLTTRD